MQDISKCFPYSTKNYNKRFINLKVLKTIHIFCVNNPVIEKAYAKGSLIYGIMIVGSDIDHLRIKINKRLSLKQKIALISKLEHELKEIGVSCLQRIKEDNYVRVFYDPIELISFPLALTTKDEVYPNTKLLKSKNKHDLLKKILKRGYKYNSNISKNWIMKMINRTNSIEEELK